MTRTAMVNRVINAASSKNIINIIERISMVKLTTAHEDIILAKEFFNSLEVRRKRFNEALQNFSADQRTSEVKRALLNETVDAEHCPSS